MNLRNTYRIGLVLSLITLVLYSSGISDLIHHVGHLFEEDHPVCTASDGTDHLHSEEYACHTCVQCTATTLNFHTNETKSLKDFLPAFNTVSFIYTAPIFQENRFLSFLRGPPQPTV